MDIGGKIKRMRIEKQLTQEELANRCELSKGFISQLENNLTSPSIATLIDILDILGTNLKEFFNEISDEKITFTKPARAVQFAPWIKQPQPMIEPRATAQMAAGLRDFFNSVRSDLFIILAPFAALTG